jgi:hypothetical protein
VRPVPAPQPSAGRARRSARIPGVVPTTYHGTTHNGQGAPFFNGTTDPHLDHGPPDRQAPERTARPPTSPTDTPTRETPAPTPDPDSPISDIMTLRLNAGVPHPPRTRSEGGAQRNTTRVTPGGGCHRGPVDLPKRHRRERSGRAGSGPASEAQSANPAGRPCGHVGGSTPVGAIHRTAGEREAEREVLPHTDDPRIHERRAPTGARRHDPRSPRPTEPVHDHFGGAVPHDRGGVCSGGALFGVAYTPSLLSPLGVARPAVHSW